MEFKMQNGGQVVEIGEPERSDDNNQVEERLGDEKLGQQEKPIDWFYEKVVNDLVHKFEKLSIHDGSQIHVDNAKLEIINSFKRFYFYDCIVNNLRVIGFLKIRPYQEHIMPQIMAGKDVIVEAGTSFEKTAVFGLPIIQKLMDILGESIFSTKRTNAPHALIITPNEATADNIRRRLFAFAKNSGITIGQNGYRNHIVVGTTAKIMHRIEKKEVSLSNLKFLVLDEADDIMDNFSEDRLFVLINDPHYIQNKATIQIMMFSTFFTSQVDFGIRVFLKNQPGYNKPVWITASPNRISSCVVLHFVSVTGVAEKNEELMKLLDQRDVNGQAIRTIIYVNDSDRADYLAILLCLRGLMARSVNEDRPEGLREKIFKLLKNGDLDVVIVCHGNVPRNNVNYFVDRIVNFDVPPKGNKSPYEEFMHRVGRTGRWKKVLVFTFIDSNDKYVNRFCRLLVSNLYGTGRKNDVPEWMRFHCGEAVPLDNGNRLGLIEVSEISLNNPFKPCFSLDCAARYPETSIDFARSGNKNNDGHESESSASSEFDGNERSKEIGQETTNC